MAFDKETVTLSFDVDVDVYELYKDYFEMIQRACETATLLEVGSK